MRCHFVYLHFYACVDICVALFCMLCNLYWLLFGFTSIWWTSLICNTVLSFSHNSYHSTGVMFCGGTKQLVWLNSLCLFNWSPRPLAQTNKWNLKRIKMVGLSRQLVNSRKVTEHHPHQAKLFKISVAWCTIVYYCLICCRVRFTVFGRVFWVVLPVEFAAEYLSCSL